MEPELFRPGDTVVLPFLIVADGAIVNVSDGIVTAEVRVGSKLIREFIVGDGLTIEQPAPEPEPDQVPHGIVTLDAETTRSLPMGPLSTLTVTFINSAGVRMHAAPMRLRGVP